MPDKIKIEVMPDGLIKVSTDQISLPAHMNAEAFLRSVARLAGGTTTRKAKHGHSLTHSHEHGHDHQHQ